MAAETAMGATRIVDGIRFGRRCQWLQLEQLLLHLYLRLAGDDSRVKQRRKREIRRAVVAGEGPGAALVAWWR